MLAKHCVYTIRRTDELLAAFDNGGLGRYSEGKRWVGAKKLLEQARTLGGRLPIVFAPAERTFRLVAWALLDEVTLGEMTTYSFSELRPLASRPPKTSLRKATDGRPIPRGFIRPYAICRTPHFLTEEGARLHPDEVAASVVFVEGATLRVLVNAYERNCEARKRCLAHYGTSCCICGFDFAAVYGEAGVGLIHVHHLRPLSQIKKEYRVDPINDLRPVCPNCHAVLHRKNPPCQIEDVKSLLQNRLAEVGAGTTRTDGPTPVRRIAELPPGAMEASESFDEPVPDEFRTGRH